MSKKIRTEAVDSLFEAILSLESREECYKFFEDICTVNELLSLSQRFEVARMLRQEKTYLEIAHTSNEEMAREFEEQIREIYPWAEIYTDRLSLSIACHIGPGSLACACTKKLKELE